MSVQAALEFKQSSSENPMVLQVITAASIMPKHKERPPKADVGGSLFSPGDITALLCLASTDGCQGRFQLALLCFGLWCALID